MTANARKVHRTVVIVGVACAVAAALPCVAGDAGATLDTVTVEGQSIPVDSAPQPETVVVPQTPKKGKSASSDENVGFFSGLAIGAVAGGPIGAMAGGIAGALLGEHYHKQKVLNHDLSADLSGSQSDKAKLKETVLRLDDSLQVSQAQQAQLSASLNHARDLSVNVAFRTGDAHLSVQDIDQLTTLGQLAGGMPDVKIQVSGHTDPRGSKDYNAALSKDRAESVAAVLTNAGVSEDRIVIEALGDEGASADGNLDEYAFQRRVSVKLIGKAAVADVTKRAATTVALVK